MANGFYELTDVALQASRFQQDNHIRQAKGLAPAVIDTFLLQALTHGLPPCSGVALGVDRLFAIAMNETNIASCLAFDFSRA